MTEHEKESLDTLVLAEIRKVIEQKIAGNNAYLEVCLDVKNEKAYHVIYISSTSYERDDEEGYIPARIWEIEGHDSLQKVMLHTHAVDISDNDENEDFSWYDLDPPLTTAKQRAIHSLDNFAYCDEFLDDIDEKIIEAVQEYEER